MRSADALGLNCELGRGFAPAVREPVQADGLSNAVIKLALAGGASSGCLLCAPMRSGPQSIGLQLRGDV